jgi:2-dehydro-3-deoxy-D-arabinonate dehydratase
MKLMKLARFLEGSKIVSGFVKENEVHIFEELGENPFAQYLRLPHPDSITLEGFLASLIEDRDPIVYPLEWVQNRFIMPMIPSEVWAAGVTYKRSVDAREDETEVKGIYDRVYESERPEVLFKGLGYRTVGPNDIICIRSDSA